LASHPDGDTEGFARLRQAGVDPEGIGIAPGHAGNHQGKSDFSTEKLRRGIYVRQIKLGEGVMCKFPFRQARLFFTKTHVPGEGEIYMLLFSRNRGFWGGSFRHAVPGEILWKLSNDIAFDAEKQSLLL
jgi:hypothetical protein